MRDALSLLDQAIANPNIRFNDVAAVAQYYAQAGNMTKLETALKKLVALAPGQPEPLYDLAALQAITGQTSVALENLKAALQLSTQRLATDPKARDLLATARTDPRFGATRTSPEFLKLVPPQ